MKFSCFALAAVMLGLATAPSAAFEAYKKPAIPQTGMQALALQAIELATPEMRKVKPDWQNYKVQAAETADSMIVSFWQPPAPGAPSDHEATATQAQQSNFIVVQLDKNTLKVVAVRQFHI